MCTEVCEQNSKKPKFKITLRAAGMLHFDHFHLYGKHNVSFACDQGFKETSMAMHAVVQSGVSIFRTFF